MKIKKPWQNKKGFALMVVFGVVVLMISAVVGTMLLGFPFTLPNHLDAGAIDQQMQACRCRLCRDRHREMFLPPADGAEIGHLPVQSRQLEQTLRHAHRLAQRQIEQAHDG